MFDRWETLPLPLARMSVALCTFRRAHASLPETHGRQTVPLQGVRTLFRPFWSSRPPHETPPAQRFQMLIFLFSSEKKWKTEEEQKNLWSSTEWRGIANEITKQSFNYHHLSKTKKKKKKKEKEMIGQDNTGRHYIGNSTNTISPNLFFLYAYCAQSSTSNDLNISCVIRFSFF